MGFLIQHPKTDTFVHLSVYLSVIIYSFTRRLVRIRELGWILESKEEKTELLLLYEVWPSSEMTQRVLKRFMQLSLNDQNWRLQGVSDCT